MTSPYILQLQFVFKTRFRFPIAHSVTFVPSHDLSFQPHLMVWRISTDLLQRVKTNLFYCCQFQQSIDFMKYLLVEYVSGLFSFWNIHFDVFVTVTSTFLQACSFCLKFHVLIGLCQIHEKNHIVFCLTLLMYRIHLIVIVFEVILSRNKIMIIHSPI